MLAADGISSSSKVEAAWEQIKAALLSALLAAYTTLVSSGQMEALETLQETILGWPDKVVAVCSSAGAPEEDGEGSAFFAGIFAETELGVSCFRVAA